VVTGEPADAVAATGVSDDRARLAQAYGVATEYRDQAGERVDVGEPTIRAVLAALGVDVTSAESIAAAIEEKRLRDWRRMLPPVYVMRQGAEQRLWVHVEHGQPATARIRTEAGAQMDLDQLDYWVDPVEVDGILVGEASFRLPGDLPLGWHVVEATSTDRRSSAPLVVAPERLDPAAIVGERQWGLMAQVYATRSRQSWGFGDLSDLATLVRWSGADRGAGFLLVNPMHSASPIPPMVPSPYLPVTRRFASPLYLRVEDVPEYAGLSPAVADRVAELAAQMRRLNATTDLLDRDAVWAAKRTALEAIHRVRLSPERADRYAGFLAREGEGLRDFATWCAIADVHGEPATWPADLGTPTSPAVAQFRATHAEAIDFHLWVQWLLDEQLAAVQEAARAAGMAVGVVHDLAVGVHPEGADAWALGRFLVRGIGVGAPPDMYNQLGQNWSQPPWHPDALAEGAFGPYRDMLRTILAHAGACGSTTCSACSGCGGCPTASRRRRGRTCATTTRRCWRS